MKGRRPHAPEGARKNSTFEVGQWVVSHSGVIGVVWETNLFGVKIESVRGENYYYYNASIDSVIPEETALAISELQTGVKP
jgi:hypothetical protein